MGLNTHFLQFYRKQYILLLRFHQDSKHAQEPRNAIETRITVHLRM